jgi:predicted metal-dependent hydrolase
MRVISSIISSTRISELRLAGAPLALRLDKRARRLRLHLAPGGGGLVLTVPRGVSQRRALAWAAGHESWAREALAAAPAAVGIGADTVLPFRGEPHRIAWDVGKPRSVTRASGVIQVGGPQAGIERRVIAWLRAEALALLTEETQQLVAQLGRSDVRVGVGDPRSRWGSCSSGGTIRYSWRLIMAPDFVRTATVAHEVAHLVHMNHGAQFHALAAELLGGDPAPARAWLRREGTGLHRIGAPP